MNTNKNLKKLILISYTGTVLMLAAAAAAAFLSAYRVAAIVIAALAAIGIGIALKFIVDGEKKRISAEKGLEKKYDKYAEIYYDKKTETANICGNLAEFTGLDVPSDTLDDTDYKKLMCEMIVSPSDAGPDIYMAAKKESWIRIRTFDSADYELTVVSDVSELVSCKNIIKSLKYYDSETGMLCRDAFISKVRSAAAANTSYIGLITVLVSGIEKITSFKGTHVADKICSKASAAIKRYENPHNVFAGRTATFEFCLLLTDTYEEGCRKYADKLLKNVEEVLADIDGSEYIRVYCGYALFKGIDHDAGSMLSAVDYAVFEAKNSSATVPVEFNDENYATSAFDFKKVQVFNSIVDRNLLSYHFQPVVDAHTGEIFGYEALMRPKEIDGIRLYPLDVIKIAEKQGMTSKIEWLTISNTVKYLSENQDLFRGKKLFVNSIPNCLITNEEYGLIFDEYGGIFDKLIIEVTEGCQISEETVKTLFDRYKSRHAQIALDDYGTGYANESTLLSIKPDYIKIDRSLITGIDAESQKRHLVANMINFAKSHGIKTLAEGVETRGELDAVITLGIDLVQGFYTSKPNAMVLLDIPEEVKNEILDINIQNVGYTRKSCTIVSSDPVDVVKLAVEGYTDVTVKSPSAFLTGNSNHPVNLRIICEDGYKGTIRLKDVNIDSGILDAPVLTMGRNCELMLQVDGENVFSYEGIRVPQTSRFILTGGGSLDVNATNNNGVIIGGSCLQSFGDILIDLEGRLNINGKGDSIVGIGGGNGVEDSLIRIVGGEINSKLKGAATIGIGAISGTVAIKINGNILTFDGSGQSVVAIGSKKGSADIECNSDITAECSGDNCCGIGTLERGGGNIAVLGGDYDITVHAKNSVGIGGMNSKADISISYGSFFLFCEGNTAVGIGDAFGSENITIINGIFNIHTAASSEFPLGTKDGRTVIHSGNISSDCIEEIKAFSPYGDKLKKRVINTEKSYRQAIIFGGSEYTYSADPAPGESFVTAYLPEGYKN